MATPAPAGCPRAAHERHVEDQAVHRRETRPPLQQSNRRTTRPAILTGRPRRRRKTARVRESWPARATLPEHCHTDASFPATTVWVDVTEAAMTGDTGITVARAPRLRRAPAHRRSAVPTARERRLPAGPFTVADYLARTEALGIAGGAVVSGSFQGFDQDLPPRRTARTRARIRRGHPGARVGVGCRNPAAGRGRCAAVRFNLRRGGSASVEHLERLARRVHALAGWHAELYVDARDLAELVDVLETLPSVSIDHLGLSAAGFRTCCASSSAACTSRPPGSAASTSTCRGVARSDAGESEGSHVRHRPALNTSAAPLPGRRSAPDQ